MVVGRLAAISINTCGMSWLNMRASPNGDGTQLMSTSRSGPRKRKLPKTDHAQVIDFWVRLYYRRFGNQYPFAGGKDGTTIKRLLRQYDRRTVKRLMLWFLYLKDPYITTTGHKIPLLWSSVPKLLEQMAAEKQPIRKGDPVSNFTAWAADNAKWCRKLADGMYPTFGGAAWARSLWSEMIARIQRNVEFYSDYTDDQWQIYYAQFLRKKAKRLDYERRIPGIQRKKRENAEAPALLAEVLSGIAGRKQHGST